jgi:hypothetical protein
MYGYPCLYHEQSAFGCSLTCCTQAQEHYVKMYKELDAAREALEKLPKEDRRYKAVREAVSSPQRATVYLCLPCRCRCYCNSLLVRQRRR